MGSSIVFKMGVDSAEVIAAYGALEKKLKVVASETGKLVTATVTAGGKIKFTFRELVKETEKVGRASKKSAGEISAASKGIVASIDAQTKAAESFTRASGKKGTKVVTAGIKDMTKAGHAATGVFGKLRLSMERNQFALQQVSFGVQDAAAVWGTTGLAGAIRASNNNATQALAIMGPMAGIIGGIALGLGAPLIAALIDVRKKTDGSAKSFELAAKSADSYKSALSSLKSQIDNLNKVDQEAAATQTEIRAQKSIRRQTAAKITRLEAEEAQLSDPSNLPLGGAGVVAAKYSRVKEGLVAARLLLTKSDDRIEVLENGLRQRSEKKLAEITGKPFSTGTPDELATELQGRQEAITGIGGMTDKTRQEGMAAVGGLFEEAQVESRRERRQEDMEGRRGPAMPTALDKQISEATVQAKGSSLDRRKKELEFRLNDEGSGRKPITGREQAILDVLKEIAETDKLVVEQLILQSATEKHKAKFNPGVR